VLAQGGELSGAEVGGHPAGAHQAATEAVAAEHGGGIQIVPAQPAAECRSGEEADVAGQSPDIADMVGQPFQLESHQAQRRGPRRRRAAAQGLDGLAPGAGMADAGVTGDRLDLMGGGGTRSAEQQPLDITMLIAECDLQVHDLLTVALETEVSRFDHAGVHRAHRHLVDFPPLDPIEILNGRQRPFAAAPGIPAAPVGVEPYRFEPGVTDWDAAVLFGDFALEQL